MGKIYVPCDKNCIANLNGKCCVDICRGRVPILKSKLCSLTTEQIKKIYEDMKKTFDSEPSFNTISDAYAKCI